MHVSAAKRLPLVVLLSIPVFLSAQGPLEYRCTGSFESPQLIVLSSFSGSGSVRLVSPAGTTQCVATLMVPAGQTLNATDAFGCYSIRHGSTNDASRVKFGERCNVSTALSVVSAGPELSIRLDIPSGSALTMESTLLVRALPPVPKPCIDDDMAVLQRLRSIPFELMVGTPLAQLQVDDIVELYLEERGVAASKAGEGTTPCSDDSDCEFTGCSHDVPGLLSWFCDGGVCAHDIADLSCVTDGVPDGCFMTKYDGTPSRRTQCPTRNDALSLCSILSYHLYEVGASLCTNEHLSFIRDFCGATCMRPCVEPKWNFACNCHGRERDVCVAECREARGSLWAWTCDNFAGVVKPDTIPVDTIEEVAAECPAAKHQCGDDTCCECLNLCHDAASPKGAATCPALCIPSCMMGCQTGSVDQCCECTSQCIASEVSDDSAAEYASELAFLCVHSECYNECHAAGARTRLENFPCSGAALCSESIADAGTQTAFLNASLYDVESCAEGVVEYDTLSAPFAFELETFPNIDVLVERMETECGDLALQIMALLDDTAAGAEGISERFVCVGSAQLISWGCLNADFSARAKSVGFRVGLWSERVTENPTKVALFRACLHETCAASATPYENATKTFHPVESDAAGTDDRVPDYELKDGDDAKNHSDTTAAAIEDSGLGDNADNYKSGENDTSVVHGDSTLGESGDGETDKSFDHDPSAAHEENAHGEEGDDETNDVNGVAPVDPLKDGVQCLSQSNPNRVGMQNPYTFNGVAFNDYSAIGVNVGSYIFSGITSSHPLGFIIDEDMFSVVSGAVFTEKNQVRYYTGTVEISISDDFGIGSYACAKHGWMGGNRRLVFHSGCPKS